MADTPLHSMTQSTAPDINDEIYVLDDPGGTPADRRMTLSDYLKVINGLTEDTAPVGSSDYAVTYDASAGGPKKVLLKNLGPYTLQGGSYNTNPADATTYYFGSVVAGALGGTGGVRGIYIPRAGVITTAYISFTCTTGTNETSSVYIRLNNTSDTLVSAGVDLSASPNTVSSTALSISVSAGDYIEIKWVTPTWATNPTAVSTSAVVLVV